MKIVLLITFLLINILPVFAYEAEIYEKNGTIYIVGHWTEKEKLVNAEHYKIRMTERTKQIEAEIQRNHEVELAQIKAQAMRDYLIAQSVPLKEIAEALRKQRFGSYNYTAVGDISSTSSVGDTSSSSTSSGGSFVASTGTITSTGGNTTNSNTNKNNFIGGDVKDSTINY